MMCDRDDLETERQHVGYKARLDDLGRINALFLEMRKAFLEEAADGAENLQVVCDGCVVERKGHGLGFPSIGVDRVRYRLWKLLDCNREGSHAENLASESWATTA